MRHNIVEFPSLSGSLRVKMGNLTSCVSYHHEKNWKEVVSSCQGLGRTEGWTGGGQGTTSGETTPCDTVTVGPRRA